jgi:hypothetical protein
MELEYLSACIMPQTRKHRSEWSPAIHVLGPQCDHHQYVCGAYLAAKKPEQLEAVWISPVHVVETQHERLLTSSVYQVRATVSSSSNAVLDVVEVPKGCGRSFRPASDA